MALHQVQTAVISTATLASAAWDGRWRVQRRRGDAGAGPWVRGRPRTGGTCWRFVQRGRGRQSTDDLDTAHANATVTATALHDASTLQGGMTADGISDQERLCCSGRFSGGRSHVLPSAVRPKTGLAGAIRSWCYREHGAGRVFDSRPKEQTSLHDLSECIRQQGQRQPKSSQPARGQAGCG